MLRHGGNEFLKRKTTGDTFGSKLRFGQVTVSWSAFKIFHFWRIAIIQHAFSSHHLTHLYIFPYYIQIWLKVSLSIYRRTWSDEYGIINVPYIFLSL